jgi:hypothetical protein
MAVLPKSALAERKVPMLTITLRVRVDEIVYDALTKSNLPNAAAGQVASRAEVEEWVSRVVEKLINDVQHMHETAEILADEEVVLAPKRDTKKKNQ